MEYQPAMQLIKQVRAQAQAPKRSKNNKLHPPWMTFIGFMRWQSLKHPNVQKVATQIRNQQSLLTGKKPKAAPLSTFTNSTLLCHLQCIILFHNTQLAHIIAAPIIIAAQNRTSRRLLLQVSKSLHLRSCPT